MTTSWKTTYTKLELAFGDGCGVLITRGNIIGWWHRSSTLLAFPVGTLVVLITVDNDNGPSH